MAEFGEYLRKLRQENRLSLRDVAARTGMSFSYLTQIEHGRREPPHPRLLQKLASAYGVSASDLMKAAGYLDDMEPVKSTKLAELDRAFQYAISDPQFEFGTRITGPVTSDVKRYIVELYEKATGKKLLTGE